ATATASAAVRRTKRFHLRHLSRPHRIASIILNINTFHSKHPIYTRRISNILPPCTFHPLPDEFLHGTLAQRCNTGFRDRCRAPETGFLSTHFVSEGDGGVDDFAFEAVRHRLLQRHRRPSQTSGDGPAARQWWSRRVLLRRRHPHTHLAD